MKGINKLRSLASATRRYPIVCEALLILSLLFAIFWTFLGRFLSGEHSVATWVDNTLFILPLFSYMSKSFATGEFPYWINSILGGMPLYNTPQFSVLYPFYFFTWNLYGSPLETLLHVHYVVLFHVGVLWINTYVMLRIFHLGIISSVLGATLFGFCANTYQYLFWVNIAAPYSWLPLALGSIYLILENNHPKVGLVLGWVSIYLLVSASPAQALIHLVYCAGFLFLAHWMIYRKDRVKRRAPLRNLILLAAGSILLSAATLIPAVLFAGSDMIRWVKSGPVIGNQTIPFDSFLTGQTKASELAKVIFPLKIQQVMGDSYLGVLPIFLALFGLFKSKHNWIVTPFFVLGLYMALSSAGDNLGFAYINYLIPFWNKIREPGRHLYLFALATCTLAAFGFEHLTEWIKGSCKFKLRKHAMMFGLFLLLLLVSYWVRQKYEVLIDDSILLGSFVAFLALLAGFRFVPRSGELVGKGLLAAVIIYPQLYIPIHIPNIKEGDYFKQANLRSHRVLKEISKLEDIRDYRLVIEDDQLSPHRWSMNAIYYGLRTFQAFMNPLPFRQWEQVFFAPQTPHYSQLLGAKYYLCCGAEPCASADYTLERQIEDCRLYSTSQARPHYFLSTQIGGSYDDAREFPALVQQNDDYMSKISVELKDARKIAEWLGTTSGSLTWEKFQDNSSLNTLSLGLRTDRRSLLVLNEYFREEWKATVNGHSHKPFRVNLNQIAVLLPEGKNQVRFEYQPRLFLWLLYLQRALLSVLTAGLLGMAVLAVSRPKVPVREITDGEEVNERRAVKR